ncbi:hypothetical protein F2Q68_00045089 [Brassica cretica]|uniref:Uncharacterized protein n=1 Tax=Brassica cretica TaxID=69181 RepID=A0A8S9LLZ8_BRACR|nr:hypothetical protein F2Q68_00045089 [Brassica cretica]
MCERAMLNERGGNGRCWMRREEREGDAGRRDESEGNAGKRDERERCRFWEEIGEKVDDVVSLLALSLLFRSPLMVSYIFTQFSKAVSICLTKDMHTYKISSLRLPS